MSARDDPQASVNWYDGDGVDGPDDGPTLTFSTVVDGSTCTVTATASEQMITLFFRMLVIQD